MKKFMMNLLLINIFFLLYQVKCNASNKKCERWNDWSECENDLISRTCNYDYSIRDLRSCKNCGKWEKWSPCTNGKTFRYLSNCSFIKEEKDCFDNKKENENTENIVTKWSEENFKYNNKKNERTFLENNNKQHKKENNLHKLGQIKNNFSEILENISQENKKIDNNRNIQKNMYKLNGDSKSPYNSFQNENNAHEKRNEHIIYNDLKSPLLLENIGDGIKEHDQLFNSSSIEQKKDKNKMNNSTLHHSNDKSEKSLYNQKKKAKKFRDNQNKNIINDTNEMEQNESKENTNGVDYLQKSEDTNNEENGNSYTFHAIDENEYDTHSDGDSKEKFNDSVKINRIYLASCMGAALILTGSIAGYIMYKEKETDDIFIDNKEDYEDNLKNKNEKSFYEEEFWALE